jgi:hypothetical protein
MYDTTYLAEKAEAAKRGAQEILDQLNKPQEKWIRSYIVDGILRIEDALGSLHVKARDIMEECDETEDDYLLRHMGTITKGK